MKITKIHPHPAGTHPEPMKQGVRIAAEVDRGSSLGYVIDELLLVQEECRRLGLTNPLKWGGSTGYNMGDPSIDYHMHIDYDRLETPEEVVTRVAEWTRRNEAERQRQINEARAILKREGVV